MAIDVDTNVDVQYTETQLQQHMDRLVLKESVRPNMILDNLRFKPVQKSKLYIPLCRMKPLEVCVHGSSRTCVPSMPTF